MIGPGPSTRPYLIRALHDWCTDNGFTPYLAVYVDETVRVPTEYVKNREIVLNVGFEATSGLRLGNEFIEFKARFGGVARDIVVPVDHVVAIYARENGQGMAFPVPGEMPMVRPGQPAAAGSGPGAAGADGVPDGTSIETSSAASGRTSRGISKVSSAGVPDGNTRGAAAASLDAESASPKIVRIGAGPGTAPAKPERKPAAGPRGADEDPPTPPKGRPPLKRVK